MIFSHVKNNMVVLFSLLVSDYFGCLHCFPNRCRSHFDFLNCSNFSVSEQNYQVLVFIFLNRMQPTFWLQDNFDLSKPFVLSLQLTEHQHHDIHL